MNVEIGLIDFDPERDVGVLTLVQALVLWLRANQIEFELHVPGWEEYADHSGV